MASANLHEGAIVANYPFDGHPDGGEDLKPVNNPTPDDATFQHLAKAYAAAHAFMSDSKVWLCKRDAGLQL
jgi:carboxypeptidase D